MRLAGMPLPVGLALTAARVPCAGMARMLKLSCGLSVSAPARVMVRGGFCAVETVWELAAGGRLVRQGAPCAGGRPLTGAGLLHGAAAVAPGVLHVAAEASMVANTASNTNPALSG